MSRVPALARFDVDILQFEGEDGSLENYGPSLTPRVSFVEMSDRELKAFGAVRCLYHIASCWLPRCIRKVRAAGSRDDAIDWLKRHISYWGACSGGSDGGYYVEGDSKGVRVRVGEQHFGEKPTREVKVSIAEVVDWALSVDDFCEIEPVMTPVFGEAAVDLANVAMPAAPQQLSLF